MEAKRASDFQMLLPHLERNVELANRYVACYEGFPGFSHPYDPLLDEYEPEMSTERMRAILVGLREGLVLLVAEAASNGAAPDDPFLGDFPVDAQRQLVAELIDELPFPEDSWRLDPTEHPFAATIGQGDVRLTTRYDPGTWRWRCSARSTRRATASTRRASIRSCSALRSPGRAPRPP